jgi:hypothetical protein
MSKKISQKYNEVGFSKTPFGQKVYNYMKKNGLLEDKHLIVNGPDGGGSPACGKKYSSTQVWYGFSTKKNVTCQKCLKTKDAK